ncbi:hypothetical protein M3A49_21400 [Paraburkholderia sp. CNPSo 3076]|nr:hypothetical protein [Paraburkholderia sp. CNPSo 3076]
MPTNAVCCGVHSAAALLSGGFDKLVQTFIRRAAAASRSILDPGKAAIRQKCHIFVGFETNSRFFSEGIHENAVSAGTFL